MADEDMLLGGNIVLSGFREVDGGSMIILKKIIGSYARKFSDRTQNFERLHVNMKKIHADAKGKFEISAKLLHGGKSKVAEHTDYNMFVAVDTVMKSIENSL